MRRLIKQAQKWEGFTRPNPMVAAAVVRDNKVIATGAHKQAGQSHAEAIALKKAGDQAKGATLYVTLEPCTHTGKTPPCTDAIIAAGIREVIYAVEDPTKKVRQNPADDLLKKAGIIVKKGLCREEAILLNDVFFKNARTSLPFVTLKVGMSLDGKIALPSNESKYITDVTSRVHAHRLRGQASAIIVGRQTVMIDNPLLDTRLAPGYPAPTKIILDSTLQLSPASKLFEGKTPVMIITGPDIPKSAQDCFKNKADIIQVSHETSGNLAWHEILESLYTKGITHVLIEGGSQVYTTALMQDIVDKVVVYIAPKILMGAESLSPFGGPGVPRLLDAKTLCHVKSRFLNPDTMISGYLHDPLLNSEH